MIRGVLNWLAGRFGSARDASEKSSENIRFLPSVLDASVRYAHGGNNSEGERSIADIKEEARRLEQQHHE